MNLSEMKTRAWWTIEDNEANPTEIDSATLTGIINDAIRELAPYLNIIKSAALVFTGGVASLPSDFYQNVGVYDGDTLLTHLLDIRNKVDNTDTTSQYFIPNNTQIYIYGITPQSTVTMWYKAYPDVLNSATEVPSNIPLQFHHYIPEVYVKAKYRQRVGDMRDYAQLMNIWEIAKKSINSATNSDRNSYDNNIVDYYGGDNI